MNATGSLPDVVPYEVKPYGGWPGDFIWQAAEEVRLDRRSEPRWMRNLSSSFLFLFADYSVGNAPSLR